MRNDVSRLSFSVMFLLYLLLLFIIVVILFIVSAESEREFLSQSIVCAANFSFSQSLIISISLEQRFHGAGVGSTDADALGNGGRNAVDGDMIANALCRYAGAEDDDGELCERCP